MKVALAHHVRLSRSLPIRALLARSRCVCFFCIGPQDPSLNAVLLS